MQKYVKTYIEYFDLTENEVMCEACGKPAVDIHHIEGRGEGMDAIKNLIALCRKCHDRAHGAKNPVSKGQFQYIHNNFLAGNKKKFLVN